MIDKNLDGAPERIIINSDEASLNRSFENSSLTLNPMEEIVEQNELTPNEARENIKVFDIMRGQDLETLLKGKDITALLRGFDLRTGIKKEIAEDPNDGKSVDLVGGFTSYYQRILTAGLSTLEKEAEADK